MKTIEEHIQKDKEILADPSTSEPMRHHIEEARQYDDMGVASLHISLVYLMISGAVSY